MDVDFFVEGTGEVIQVAYSITNISSDREVRGIVAAAKSVKEARSFIIVTYEEEKELVVEDVNIKVIPIWKWLLNA